MPNATYDPTTREFCVVIDEYGTELRSPSLEQLRIDLDIIENLKRERDAV